MPVYEYECEQCGTHFERTQSVRDEPIRRCPECSGTVHKVFHPAGIIFKGSGWYITDSRKSSSSAVTGESKNGDSKAGTDAKPEPKPALTTEKSAESKAESKAEAKPESK